MSERIREAFEKAAKIAWGEPSIERDGSGYMDGYVDSAWWGWQAAWKQSRREALMEAAELIPSNWCDSRLTGHDGIGQPPWDCRHIESLLNKIRADIRAAAEEKGK